MIKMCPPLSIVNEFDVVVFSLSVFIFWLSQK